ncbi:MAG: hypothetical protein M3P45_08415 [Acidobacteriota bacterium]|nr:hypothetical protein [Acidobacteriota bacterium]
MEPGLPSNFTFGGGSTSTVLHPVILVALIITAVMILFAPRKYLSAPFLLLVFLGSIGQQITIAGLHLYVARILIIAGCIRIATAKLRSEQGVFVGGFDRLDRVFVLWVVLQCTVSIVRNHASSGVLLYESGYFIDYLLAYFFLRYLIRDQDDILRVIKVFAALTFILGLAMVNEKFHGQNIFGYLGALPVTPGAREGSIRAQSAFAHPILAGVFGVVLIPLFWWLWQSGKAKTAALIGFLGSCMMVATSASSTPLMAFLGAIVAYFAWPIRKSMRVVRWGIVVALIALHMVMKAPVWMLIAHVDVIAGNSGYHRAMLIDQSIRHFWEWWLVGTNAAGTWGWDMWDLSNAFVQQADEGGLATFICFVLIIAKAFSKIGKARKIVEGDKQQEWFMWFLGVTLVTHCMCFFGITYFDATRIVWFAFLSIVTAATAPILATAKEEAPESEPLLARSKPKLLAPKSARTPEFAGTRQRNISVYHPK